MLRIEAGLAAAFALLASADPLPAAGSMPGDGDCERGKTIERALGNRGYRVVLGGGYKVRADESVKVQVWQNEARDWVITEAFLEQNRTCVVRSGIRLHMMY